jgi:hypothetical protein
LFREETEGEKISRTHPKPCACTNSFWYGTEEERVNSNPSIHKLTLFIGRIWEGEGKRSAQFFPGGALAGKGRRKMLGPVLSEWLGDEIRVGVACSGSW